MSDAIEALEWVEENIQRAEESPLPTESYLHYKYWTTIRTELERAQRMDWVGIEKILRHARSKNESCSLELTNWIADNKPSKQALSDTPKESE